jgi:hypothetical protein
MKARLVLIGLGIASCAAPAFAHAFLQHAVPGAGAVLSVPPKQIALSFSEQLEPVFSGVAVADSSGRSVESGPVLIGKNAMVAHLRPLAPGSYRVSWHAVSVDTHRTEGAYSFTVKP